MLKRGVLFLVLVLAGLSTSAQDPDPRIFSEWFIIEYVEDGVAYLPPDAYTIEIFDESTQDCPYLFHFPNPFFSGFDCIESITETSFTILALGILTEGEICQDGPPECETFFSMYYYFYRDAELSGDPLSYLIEDGQNGKRTMTVTNLSGDYAIYTNQSLSVDEFNKRKAVPYPNPVRDRLVIDTSVEINKIQVYSSQGKLMLETTERIIDFAQLPDGLYFVKIINDQGQELHKILRN